MPELRTSEPARRLSSRLAISPAFCPRSTSSATHISARNFPDLACPLILNLARPARIRQCYQLTTGTHTEPCPHYVRNPAAISRQHPRREATPWTRSWSRTPAAPTPPPRRCAHAPHAQTPPSARRPAPPAAPRLRQRHTAPAALARPGASDALPVGSTQPIRATGMRQDRAAGKGNSRASSRMPRSR